MCVFFWGGALIILGGGLIPLLPRHERLSEASDINPPSSAAGLKKQPSSPHSGHCVCPAATSCTGPACSKGKRLGGGEGAEAVGGFNPARCPTCRCGTRPQSPSVRTNALVEGTAMERSRKRCSGRRDRDVGGSDDAALPTAVSVDPCVQDCYRRGGAVAQGPESEGCHCRCTGANVVVGVWGSLATQFVPSRCPACFCYVPHAKLSIGAGLVLRELLVRLLPLPRWLRASSVGGANEELDVFGDVRDRGVFIHPDRHAALSGAAGQPCDDAVSTARQPVAAPARRVQPGWSPVEAIRFMSQRRATLLDGLPPQPPTTTLEPPPFRHLDVVSCTCANSVGVQSPSDIHATNVLLYIADAGNANASPHPKGGKGCGEAMTLLLLSRSFRVMMLTSTMGLGLAPNAEFTAANVAELLAKAKTKRSGLMLFATRTGDLAIPWRTHNVATAVSAGSWRGGVDPFERKASEVYGEHMKVLRMLGAPSNPGRSTGSTTLVQIHLQGVSSQQFRADLPALSAALRSRAAIDGAEGSWASDLSAEFSAALQSGAARLDEFVASPNGTFGALYHPQFGGLQGFARFHGSDESTAERWGVREGHNMTNPRTGRVADFALGRLGSLLAKAIRFMRSNHGHPRRAISMDLHYADEDSHTRAMLADKVLAEFVSLPILSAATVIVLSNGGIKRGGYFETAAGFAESRSCVFVTSPPRGSTCRPTASHAFRLASGKSVLMRAATSSPGKFCDTLRQSRWGAVAAARPLPAANAQAGPPAHTGRCVALPPLPSVHSFHADTDLTARGPTWSLAGAIPPVSPLLHVVDKKIYLHPGMEPYANSSDCWCWTAATGVWSDCLLLHSGVADTTTVVVCGTPVGKKTWDNQRVLFDINIAPRLPLMTADDAPADSPAPPAGSAPNVLILELDSVSRGHADRYLPKTMAFLRRLQRDRGLQTRPSPEAAATHYATEFALHNPVGANSIPNQLAMLSGCIQLDAKPDPVPANHSIRVFSATCDVDEYPPCPGTTFETYLLCPRYPRGTSADLLDDPWLHRVAKRLGYTTAFTEDFCYRGSPFGIVDMFFPEHDFDNVDLADVHCAISSCQDPRNKRTGAIGAAIAQRLRSKITLDYLEQLWENNATRGLPKFAFTSLIAAHSYKTDIPAFVYATHLLDQVLPAFLEAFLKSPAGRDTVVVLRSDHGLQSGPWAFEFSQQWEHKQPMLHLLLPYAVATPEVRARLADNSARLVTSFDLYNTLMGILTSSAPATTRGGGSSEVPLKGPIPWAYNLLTQHVPENRSCSSAGVARNFCGCANEETGEIDGESPLRPLTGICNHLNKFQKGFCVERSAALDASFGVQIPLPNTSQ